MIKLSAIVKNIIMEETPKPPKGEYYSNDIYRFVYSLSQLKCSDKQKDGGYKIAIQMPEYVPSNSSKSYSAKDAANHIHSKFVNDKNVVSSYIWNITHNKNINISFNNAIISHQKYDIHKVLSIIKQHENDIDYNHDRPYISEAGIQIWIKFNSIHDKGYNDSMKNSGGLD